MSVQLAVIGFFFLWVMHCPENVCLSVFHQISTGSNGRKTSGKNQWPAFVEFPVSEPLEKSELPSKHTVSIFITVNGFKQSAQKVSLIIA